MHYCCCWVIGYIRILYEFFVECVSVCALHTDFVGSSCYFTFHAFVLLAELIEAIIGFY